MRAQSVQYFVGQALLEPCTHPKAGKLLWEKTRLAQRCTPKSPAPVGVCEDCCKEAWFCLCLSLLAASSTGAEQQQNKSRHQINCNPVMNTMLAAVLICSLHMEENCSLFAASQAGFEWRTNPFAKQESSALSYRVAALLGWAVLSPLGSASSLLLCPQVIKS